MSGPSTNPLRVRPATPDERDIGLQLLFSRCLPEERSQRVAEALRAVATGQLNLDALLLAFVDHQPVGAALTQLQPDGTALVWPPMIAAESFSSVEQTEGSSDAAGCGLEETQQQIEHALLEQLCRQIDAWSAMMGQCLLDPDEAHEQELLSQFGFEVASELFFLARGLQEPLPALESPSEFSAVTYHDEQDDALFAAIVEQTYVDSRDCPALNGKRTGLEALRAHRLPGQFTPAGWRRYQVDGVDVGVVLLNPHPEQQAVELVYFGVTPSHRGHGLGVRILADSLQWAQAAGAQVVFLAVDAQNEPANRLYARLGFSEIARRIVMLRFPSASSASRSV